MGNPLNEYYIICAQLLNLAKSRPSGRWDERYNYNEEKWKLHSLCDMFYVSQEKMQDSLAILISRGHITDNKFLLEITPAGRICALEGTYDVSSTTLIFPDGYKPTLPPEKEIEIKFETHLSIEKKRLLVEFLTKENYVNDAVKFVDFLNGESDNIGIEINQDKLVETSKLLDLMSRQNLIGLTFGKGYQKFLEQNISPFSLYGEKEQIKAQLRKASNKTWSKTSMEKDLTDFVTTLSQAYILCCLYLLR